MEKAKKVATLFVVVTALTVGIGSAIVGTSPLSGKIHGGASDPGFLPNIKSTSVLVR